MSGDTKKLIAFNYFGGKFTWLDELYKYFPSDITNLIDLFGGSFVVSLNYSGRVIKTANEINEDITNFFIVLRDHTQELIAKLELTPCSNAEYMRCWEKSDDNIEQARRFYVRVRQSFFGLGAQRKNKGFHFAKTLVNAEHGETVSRWNNSLDKLLEVAELIRFNFQIINYHYEKAIDKLDFKKAFFYCDPPYVKASRVSYNDYMFEFSDDDHRKLADKLHNIEGRAMISGYNDEEENGLMTKLYKDWHKVKFPIKGNNIRSSLKKANGNQPAQECIWMNYDPAKVNSQLSIYDFIPDPKIS